MTLRFAGACLTALAIHGGAACASRQGPGAATPAQPPTRPPPAAAAVSPAPPGPPGRPWHGSLSAGLGLASGAQAQRGYQFDAAATRQFSAIGHFTGNVSHEYEKITYPSESLSADRSAASVGADFVTTKHTVLMARSLFLRDQLLEVDARFEQLIGYGGHFFGPKRHYELYLVPGLSVFKQDLTYSDLLGWQAGLGFYERFVVKIAPTWSVDQSLRFRNNVTDADRSIEALARIQLMLTKTLSVQLSHQFNHESIVPDGSPNYLQTLSAGLRFQF